MHYRRLLVALAAVLAAALLGPAAGIASADHRDANAPLNIELLKPQVSQVREGTYNLTAQIRAAEGASAGNRLVRFYASVDFLGATRALVGEAVADASGTAYINYRPSWDGTHELWAEIPGVGGVNSIASHVVTFEAASIVTLDLHDSSSLTPIARFVPFAALAVAAGVWGTLALVVGVTVSRMRTAGRTA